MEKILISTIIIFFCIVCLQKHNSVRAQDACGDAMSEDVSMRKCCCLKVASDVESGSAGLSGILKGFWEEAKKLVMGGMSEDDTNTIKLNRACEANGVPTNIKTGKEIKNGAEVCNDNCICKPNEKDNPQGYLCDAYLSKKKEYPQCVECFKDGNVWTVLGCLYVGDWKSLIEKNVFGLGIGIAGIISLFCIIMAAISLQTSAGNQEKVKKAQQLLTSCITGLILIIFSVFILRLIGVNILQIPGLG